MAGTRKNESRLDPKVQRVAEYFLKSPPKPRKAKSKAPAKVRR